MKALFIFYLIFIFSHLNAFENGFNKHDFNSQISEYVMMGERCSGTKFVNALITSNLRIKSKQLAQKHFYPWFNVSQNQKIDEFQLTYSETKRFFQDSDHVLFIFLVRDPYDWLRSFFNHPHHVVNRLKKNFSTFISSGWECYDANMPIQYWGVDNYNPWSGQSFKNILQLRKHKNLNFINVSSFVKNYLFVRYEDVRDNQEGFIDFLSSFYCIDKNPSFRSRDDYIGFQKQQNKTFEIPKYFIPSKKDVLFINSSIDWTIENQLGYSKKSIIDLITENN